MAAEGSYVVHMNLFLGNMLGTIVALSGNSHQLRSAELVVIGELAVESLANPHAPNRVRREFVVMIDTWENMLALRDALESESNYSSVDGQMQARFFGDPIPIVMVPIDQLDPRPSVSNMTRMPQINPREPPYSDAGLTRDEMEGLAREYRIEGRGDAVEGDYVLIGSGVATVLLWACVSWLWNTVFA